MPVLKLDLSSVKTLSQLSDSLGVDVKALHLVTLTTEVCKSPKCNLLQVENNNKWCILCSQSWFPRLQTRNGEKAINCRGHGLFGRQFLRSYNGSTVSSCCCEHLLCEKIGYSHEGAFRFPTKPDQLDQAIGALGIQSPTLRQNIVEKPSHYKIASWHFHQSHLERDPRGKLHFKKMSIYKEEEGKSWSFPPPNASLERYIESISSNNYCRDGNDDNLPPWFIGLQCLQARQQSPPSDDSQQPPSSSAKRPSSSIASMSSSSAKRRRTSTRPSASSTDITPQPQIALTSPESIQNKTQEEQIRYLTAHISKQMQQIDRLNSQVTAISDELIQVRAERDKEKQANVDLQSQITGPREKINSLQQKSSLSSTGILVPR